LQALESLAVHIRVLHLEDNPMDSELVELALREAGLPWDIVRVETRDAFVDALEKGGFDIILSDYRLPTYDGLEALRETRTRRPELAFVFFTATLGEERAVEALKAGATDFVAKGNRERLAPALQRAVAEAAERAARRRVEEALRQKEASFRLLFDSNPLPMWVFDRETLRFLEVNGAAVAHYGYTREEFLGMRITDIRPPEDAARVESSVQAEGGDEPVRHSGTWRHRLKNGRVIDVEIVAHDLAFGERPGRLVVAHDITDRKRLEGQLLQSQKLEAIGQLAGGVAHDFNNLLNVILGYADLALRELPKEAPQAPRLDQIRRAAERGATLTRQLLAFSRKQVREPKVLDLNRTLADVQGMLGRLIGENIEIVTSFDAGLGHVEADPGQIEQALLNLAVNARDAMPHGGKLILETANVDFDPAYAKTHPGSRPGPHVRLAVSDTGHGMDPSTLARLFEPFFTTKPRGKGTGLGLATVYGIVRQSDGHIDVYSEPGRGSTFKIYLPRVDKKGAAVAEDQPESDATPLGTEAILLVEDDDALRALVAEVLGRHGYVVLEAEGPEAGLLAAQSHAGTIHMMITDVIMPQMSGRDLAARLHALRPETKILYMSGYTDQAIGHHGVIAPGTHFLQKPFASKILLRKVRAVLDDARPPEP
jgi:PAS domain S-box-containing protein